MTVVGDFVFPGEQFVLNETTEVPDLEPDITIEQMVAHVDEGLTPYFRISAQNIQNVERALEADSTIKNIEPLERVDHERFYRAHWTSGVEGLMTVLQDTNGGIKAATFHDGEWEVRLLFADRKNLKACFEQCRKELDSSIELVRVFDRSNPATYGEYDLTQEQRDALLIALEIGYFDVPKQGDVDEIGGGNSGSPHRRPHSDCGGATGTS